MRYDRKDLPSCLSQYSWLESYHTFKKAVKRTYTVTVTIPRQTYRLRWLRGGSLRDLFLYGIVMGDCGGAGI